MINIKKKAYHYFANKFANASVKYLEKINEFNIKKLLEDHELNIKSVQEECQRKIQIVKQSAKLHISKYEKEVEKIKETYKIKEKELEKTRSKFDESIFKIYQIHKDIEKWVIDSGPLISSTVEFIRKYEEAVGLCSKITQETNEVYHNLYEHEFAKDAKNRMSLSLKK